MPHRRPEDALRSCVSDAIHLSCRGDRGLSLALSLGPKDLSVFSSPALELHVYATMPALKTNSKQAKTTQILTGRGETCL